MKNKQNFVLTRVSIRIMLRNNWIVCLKSNCNLNNFCIVTLKHDILFNNLKVKIILFFKKYK